MILSYLPRPTPQLINLAFRLQDTVASASQHNIICRRNADAGLVRHGQHQQLQPLSALDPAMCGGTTSCLRFAVQLTWSPCHRTWDCYVWFLGERWCVGGLFVWWWGILLVKEWVSVWAIICVVRLDIYYDIFICCMLYGVWTGNIRWCSFEAEDRQLARSIRYDQSILLGGNRGTDGEDPEIVLHASRNAKTHNACTTAETADSHRRGTAELAELAEHSEI